MLIDARGENNGPCLAVLGLGLNIALTDEEKKTIDQSCTSLEQISSDTIDRNSLVIEIVHALTELFENFPSSGFDSFHQDWKNYDRLFEREVKVLRGEDSFPGIAMGIDESGALLLDEGNGALSRFLSGDVSLRLNE